MFGLSFLDGLLVKLRRTLSHISMKEECYLCEPHLYFLFGGICQKKENSSIILLFIFNLSHANKKIVGLG